MKAKLSGILIGCLLVCNVKAQAVNSKNYRNYPIVLSVQFHSLSLPFRDLKSNFSNVGFSVGTEVSHNGKNNWVQQFNFVWYRNRTAGNGILVYTQTAWRPTIASGVYTELKAGVGYTYSFRPVESYKPANGNWESVGHKGKGMLALPVGISVGYNKYSTHTYFSPFLSYQCILLNKYNKSIPVMPETLIQVGSRIHF